MKVIITALVTILVVSAGGLIFAFSGIYNVSAREPHWDITRWFLNTARERSVKFHSNHTELPPDSEALISHGFSHFHAMCRHCHGAPGYSPDEFALGLYPKPPAFPPDQPIETDEYYWIISNGFKMTGMPSFADTHDRNEIFGILAFVKELPEMSADEYKRLAGQAGSVDNGHGHTHGEEENGNHQSKASSAEENHNHKH